ncbi:MAG TPA: hypothetical protein VGF75_02320 [Candidatus Saccharimonadales bacterium]|jgi:hypothetical protein
MRIEVGRLTAEVLDSLGPDATRYLPEGWLPPIIGVHEATPPEFYELAVKLLIGYQARIAVDAAINDSTS